MLRRIWVGTDLNTMFSLSIDRHDTVRLFFARTITLLSTKQTKKLHCLTNMDILYGLSLLLNERTEESAVVLYSQVLQQGRPWMPRLSWQ